jgi:hypothetical protein
MRKVVRKRYRKRPNLKVFRWTVRILALIVFLFGILFYFGYGNPLPFVDPDDTLFDTIWKIVFPLMFLGLLLGWLNENLGGWLIVLPIVIASVVGIFLFGEFIPGPMIVPFLIGVCYLVLGDR